MKKIISLLLALTMIFSMSSAVFAEDAVTAAPAETVEAVEESLTYDVKAYEEATSLMESLLGEGIFGSDALTNVTRAQFVSGVAKIFDIPELDGDSEFTDVAKDHPLKGAVNTALASGWVSKAEKFMPDSDITFAQAIKILLVAADYQMLADAKGGYPSGYLSVATEIDLLDGIQVSKDATVSVAQANILFYNLMLAPVFEVTTYGDQMAFERGNKTYIEKLYDAYPVEGVVTATEHNSIVLDAPFKKDNGKIAIDGIEYKYSDADISMLGKNVVAYCAKDNSKLKTVYCLIPDANQEIYVSRDDYAGITGTKLSYFDGAKIRKHNLDPAYKVIYNGRRVASLDVASMLDDIGATIRLLSNNDDDVYEYIFVDSYTYGVVTNADYVNGYIGLKTPEELIDLTDDAEHVCYLHKPSGETVEIFELAIGNVLAVKASQDNRIYDIVVLPNATSGMVTGMYLEENEVDIAGTTYKATNAFIKNYINTGLVTLGDSVTVAIGMYGEIACLLSNSAGASYGHLHDIHKDPTGMKPTAYVKIYTASGGFQAYELAEKVVIDGVKMERDKAYDNHIAVKFNENQMDTENPVLVIKFTTDKDGYVNMIDFATEDTSLFGKELDPQNNLIKYYSKLVPSDGLYTSSSSRGIASKVNMESSIIMSVPENVEDRDDETLYSTMTGASLNTNYAGYYQFDVYDIDEYGNAGYVVLYDAAGLAESIIERNTTYIIEKTRKSVFEEEEGYTIQCWTNNKYETLFMPNTVEVKKNGTPSTLAPGDIVRFSIKNGKISGVAVDYYMVNGAHVFNSTSSKVIQGYAGGNATVFAQGRVYSASSNAIALRAPDAGLPDAGSPLSNIYAIDSDTTGSLGADFNSIKPYRINTYIACYDKTTGEIRTIKPDAIHTEKGYGANADKAIIRLDHYGGPTCLIIVR